MVQPNNLATFALSNETFSGLRLFFAFISEIGVWKMQEKDAFPHALTQFADETMELRKQKRQFDYKLDRTRLERICLEQEAISVVARSFSDISRRLAHL